MHFTTEQINMTPRVPSQQKTWKNVYVNLFQISKRKITSLLEKKEHIVMNPTQPDKNISEQLFFIMLLSTKKLTKKIANKFTWILHRFFHLSCNRYRKPLDQ